VFVVERVVIKIDKMKKNLSNYETEAGVVVEKIFVREGR